MKTNIADAIDAALERRKQSMLAQELGWPESKVSEWKAKLKQDGAVFLEKLGLKLVPEELDHYDSQKVELIVKGFALAAQSLTPQQLK